MQDNRAFMSEIESCATLVGEVSVRMMHHEM